MDINKIDNDLIISKNYKECYLLYTTREYYLFKPDDNEYSTVRIDISEKPSAVEETLIIVFQKIILLYF